jgi:hypothetical protein
MTTATGDHAFDFTGDQEPFSDASFTKRSTAEARIVSGNYRNVGGGTGAYTAHTYGAQTFAGSGDVTIKIEVNDCNITGDGCFGLIVDGTGAGYWMEVRGSLVSVEYTTNYGINGNTSVGYANDNTFSAGQVYSLTLTRGSPNTLVMKRDGTTITPTTGGTTHTPGTALGSTLYAGVAVLPNNTGNCYIGSFAMDGITASLTPIRLRWAL